MAEVTYDDSSLRLDGQRVWLVSGSVHYFRLPSALWYDRLLKARRAGLNCVSTVLPWNLHEPRDGQFRFDGDLDVVEFVRMAGELGLYVILRPGPYIGAEWDGGGLPGWLLAKSGMKLRTSSAAYTHYFGRYFNHILPRLAEHQVTRGGGIVLVQNEHEYMAAAMPDRLAYLEFITQIFHRNGFEVPIITCNVLSEPPVPGAIECINAWGDGVQQLKKLRIRHPMSPMLVTEFRCGQAGQWGQNRTTRDGRETARRAFEILGCGAQYNYYMFHGGTNFGFGAGRLPAAPAAWQTTSHDFDAPVAEGGGLTPKYYLTRLPNLFANHMGRFLAGSVMEEPGFRLHDTSDVLNLAGPDGSWAIITSNGREEISSARVSLPDGRDLHVPLTQVGATAIPYQVQLDAANCLDYSNVLPLGLFTDRLLVFVGPQGWQAEVSLNGTPLRAAIPDEAQAPTVIEHQGFLIALLPESLVRVTWPMEDALLIGPAFVGETAEDILPGEQPELIRLGFDGQVSRQPMPQATDVAEEPKARLGTWRRVGVAPEPAAEALDWQPLSGPSDVDHLGVHQGYVWYRVEIPSPRARKVSVVLPGCDDRAQLYLNGEYIGTWGRGAGASRELLDVSLRKGDNVLVAMVDNLGRFHAGGRLGEAKGLHGHIYAAKRIRTRRPKLEAVEGFNRRLIPRRQTHLLEQLQSLSLWQADFDLALKEVHPVQLSFEGIAQHVAVLCNDRLVAFFESEGTNWGELTLSSELVAGDNRVRVLFWGEAIDDQALDCLVFRELTENLTDRAQWGWRPWSAWGVDGPQAGKHCPASYQATFSAALGQAPLFVKLAGCVKGQLYLNGHNLGRFWLVGPQDRYYLPGCWLKDDDNQLIVFDETGAKPSSCRLEYLPTGPYSGR